MKKKDSKLLFFTNKKFTFGKILPSDFDKFTYTKLIKEHGGTLSTLLSTNTTHYIVDEWEKSADKCCGFVVHFSFLINCIEQQILIEELDYLVSPKEKENNEMKLSSGIRFSNVSFLNEEKEEEEEIKAELEVEPAPAHKISLTQLREQQRLEREKEKIEKKERMEREKLERKMEIEREKQQRLEEILREKEEKKKEMMELLKPAFINEVVEETPLFELEFASNSEFFSYNPLDDLFLNALEEEFKEKINQKEEEKKLKELEELKKREEKLKKKMDKKKQIKFNIIENAKKGKDLGREIKLLKKSDYELIKQQRIEERERKQQEWIEEQAKRREEWLKKKEEKKIEKKEKKQKWIEFKDQILLTEANEKGKKLFFGKIDFSDINNQVSLNVIRKEFFIEKRKEGMMNIFKSFGSIVETKENWEKGFIFVVYSTEEEAEKAANDLAIYKIRKQLCNEQKKQLAASGNDEICAPLPTFYTRWPKNQNRKIEIPPSLPPAPKQEKPIPSERGARGGRGRGGRGRGLEGGRGGREGTEGSRGRGGRGGAERSRGRGGRGSEGSRGGSRGRGAPVSFD